jgi:glycerol-3-phosphate acyltransferase PlsY
VSSVGALSAITAAPVTALVFLDVRAALALAAIALYVTWRHRENIARLRAGTEPRIGQAK